MPVIRDEFRITSMLLQLPLYLIAIALLGSTPSVFALTVEEAYRAIPHNRTVFDLNAAKMRDEEREYVYRLFKLVDLAIVERVGELLYISSSGSKGNRSKDYDRILAQMNLMKIPPRLEAVHQLVVDAIKEQRAALRQWQKKGFPSNFDQDQRVLSSSQKLRQAYSHLLQLFPKEGQHNKAAFFDYLCALDFI